MKMREILFRGKRLDNKAWETGGLVPVRAGCSDEQFYITDKMTGYQTQVDSSTIGQFTGLTDKNGVKIFEGDILHFTDTSSGTNVEWNCLVEYIACAFACWRLVGDENTYTYFSHWSYPEVQWEVVGNVHDNPMLLLK